MGAFWIAQFSAFRACWQITNIMKTQDLIFVGVQGAVLALDRSSGVSVWTRDLKGSEFVSVLHDSGGLFAATRGEVYRISPLSGQILWNNPLKGRGYGLVTLASATGSSAGTAVAAEKRERDQQESAI
jgi:outer membrane protein assembly factor BamB